MNMRTRTRPNACEVRFAKVIKGSDETNSFPLPPRRNITPQEDTRDSLQGELRELLSLLDGWLEVDKATKGNKW